MKQYDLYVAMTPGSRPEEYIGELTMKLMQSGLKYARHIGSKESMAERRDVRRLVDESGSMLYVSDEANNSAETSSDAVRQADRNGVDIYVIRFDNSNYPSDVADILANARCIFDATNADSRHTVIDDMLIRLGGNVAPDTTGTRAVTDPAPVPETVEQAIEENERPIRRPQSTWTIVAEVLLGIVVIAGIVALAIG